MKPKQFVPLVESSIPVPKKAVPESTYSAGLRLLKIGDSMWFPSNAESMRHLAKKIFGKGSYVARMQSKNNEPGCRVWRTK